jgi:hypothetical protein
MEEDPTVSENETNRQTFSPSYTVSSGIPWPEPLVDSNEIPAGTVEAADLSKELSYLMQAPLDKNKPAGIFYYSLPESRMLSEAKRDIVGLCSEIVTDLEKDHPLTRDWPKGLFSLRLQDLFLLTCQRSCSLC